MREDERRARDTSAGGSGEIVIEGAKQLLWSKDGDFPTIAVIVGLLLLGTTIVYVTGGTGYAFPYVMLVPVLVAAARYRVAGGIAVALAAALLLGPAMPLDVTRGIDQSTMNWIIRAVFFVLLGGVSGWLFAFIGRQNAERDRLARIDRATGLPNRTALEERLDQALTGSLLQERSLPAVFMVRIVDFHEALDAIGMDAGEELAGNTARMIENAGVGAAPAYRFSASEMAFVIEEPVWPVAAAAARIKAVGEQPISVRGVPVRVELCVGAERAVDDDTGRPYELIRRARLALAIAQEQNQDCAVYDPSHERPSGATFRLITRMRHALDKQQFELYYQPKVRLADGAVKSVEALIRWNDPEHGLVPPGQFMSKVERTSLIRPITRFAFREACAFVQERPDLSVCVNLSPRNIYDDELLEEICLSIDQYNIHASRIEVEITEGTVTHDPTRAAEYLRRFRERGMPVSIDDFGTGYSSFSYLHRLPVTGLKVDRSFIVECDADPRVQTVLQCIAQVGNALGLEVTAEGVETEQQLTNVRNAGCDLVQGYHYARPLPADELDQWMTDFRSARSVELT